ncbi:zf-HC2 domain-containing protein [Streptomyces sp. WAC08241]|uniref:zf-HC2 domain-containing protein n=1 Tax=Streptomyces sp. WAC08241 TaxID=2487421 RepID=UPI000F7840B8|nr:anti-sigma factor [Streptomyces sp. WAC08241]RSS40284.1 zf-HC2 domain-containing protein [Streptomyces sp. WAC08241]
MTSTADRADTTQHPDVSEISDLAEGLLSPSRSAAVRRHVDGCPLCADVRSSLEEIRSLLGTLPGPPRMPVEIAGRIDAALAAEALLDATAPGSDTRNDDGDDSDSRVSRETSHPSVGASPPPSPGSDRPAGRPRAATGPGRPRRPRRRIALFSTIGAAFGAAILGTSLYLSQAGDMAGDGVANGVRRADASAEVAAAPFSGSPVEERVQDLLSKDRTLRTPQGVGPESMSSDTGTTSRRSGDGTVPACVLAGTGRTDPVLAHERGEYRGKSAYLLVLTDPADTVHVQAYVLDASCADRAENGKAAEVLLSKAYPRS